MLWLIFWGVLFSALFYYYCIKPMSHWKRLGIKQGTPVWLLGDTFNILIKRESFYECILRLYKQHPKERYFGIYQMTRPTLVIRDPDLIKQVTMKDFDCFIDRLTPVPDGADPLCSRNLFSLKGQDWREMRTVLSPAFTSSKMKTMFVLILDTARAFVDYHKSHDNDIIEVEMKDICDRFAIDVIASVGFGVKTDSIREKRNQFYLMGKEAIDFRGLKLLKLVGFGLFPKLFTWLNVSILGKNVETFFINLINDTIKTREEKGIVRPDMIHLLLEARQGKLKDEDSTNVDTGFATVDASSLKTANESYKKVITNLDIAAQAVVFFFAGFETVATEASFMAYELAINPDIQTRLRDEIEETHRACGGKLTYEALMKMKYMDMVFSETLRKWVIAMPLDRLCTKPYTIPPLGPNDKPLHLNKGDIIWIPMVGIHRDPENYPQPEKFDPERFSDENKKNIKPCTYFPFGIGPRHCIGCRFASLEIKTLIYHVLLEFDLVPIKKTNIPLRISRSSFNLSAENGIWLGMKSRRKESTN